MMSFSIFASSLFTDLNKKALNSIRNLINNYQTKSNSYESRTVITINFVDSKICQRYRHTGHQFMYSHRIFELYQWQLQEIHHSTVAFNSTCLQIFSCHKAIFIILMDDLKKKENYQPKTGISSQVWTRPDFFPQSSIFVW